MIRIALAMATAFPLLGCANLFVQWFTSPLDIRNEKVAEYSGEPMIEKSSPAAPSEEIVLLEDLGNSGDVVTLRYGMYVNHRPRQEVRIERTEIWKVYNPVGDVLEIPATIVDLPFALIGMIFLPERLGGFGFGSSGGPNLRLQLLEEMGRGLLPGTNVDPERESSRAVLETKWGRCERSEYIPFPEETATVTLLGLPSVVKGDRLGRIRVNLRDWGMTSADLTNATARIELRTSYSYGYRSDLGMVCVSEGNPEAIPEHVHGPDCGHEFRDGEWKLPNP